MEKIVWISDLGIQFSVCLPPSSEYKVPVIWFVGVAN